MRNRDTEWDKPMLRFLGAFILPPALSGLLLVVVSLAFGRIHLSDIPAALFSYAYGAVFATAVPSIIYFLVLEKLYESKEALRNSRARFSLAGLAMGTVFGGVIGVYLQGIVVFVVIGWLVGWVTAYIIFPKRKVMRTRLHPRAQLR